jgi:hypothetical protein
MMEAARTSETSVDNHFTRQYNPEDSSEQQRSAFNHKLESEGTVTTYESVSFQVQRP